MPGDLLPTDGFSTEQLPPRDQFAAWRANIALMFDSTPPGGAEPAMFPASSRSYIVGPLVIGQTHYPAQRYSRDAVKIERDKLDIFLLRLHLVGGHDAIGISGTVEARVGDIDIIDMAQPFACDALPSSLIVMAVPRVLMETSLPEARAMHGLVLHGDRALGALLADHIRALMKRLPEMTTGEADAVASAVMGMVAACLRPWHDSHPQTGQPQNGILLARVKRRIEDRLRTRDLTIDQLCAEFGLSRASLYRLFEPMGGVKRYIRDRRLVGAFVALADSTQRHRSVGEIAFDWGFASEAHFGRIFRGAFGCTPGSARDLHQPALPGESRNNPLGAVGVAYAEWLRRLAVRDR